MDPWISIDRVTSYARGLDHPGGIAALSSGEVVSGGESGRLDRISADG